MKRTTTLLIAMSLCLAIPAYAGSGSLGLTFSQIIDERSYGGVFSYETQVAGAPAEFEGQLQVGDTYRGKYHAEIKFPVLTTEVKLYTYGLIKGYSLDDLGRQQDIGAAIEIPNTSFGFGVFGRNAGPFGAPNLLDDAAALGYDEAVLESIGAAGINPAPTGLTFKDGSSFNVLAYLDFNIGQIEGTLQVLPEIVGDGEKAHQAVATFQTDWTLPDGIDLQVGWDVGVQTYDGEIEYETAALVAIGVNFGGD